jgi:type IV secretory pathway TrbF-like protein
MRKRVNGAVDIQPKNVAGVRDFVDRLSQERTDKFAWRRAFFLSILLYPIGIALMVYFATLPRVQDFVIEHDRASGQYIALGPAKPFEAPDVNAQRALIAHFIEDLYTITDEHSQVNVRRRIFAHIPQSAPAYQAISAMLHDQQIGTDAMRRRQLTYAVTVDNVDSVDASHFTADYTLRIYDARNSLQSTQHRRAQIVAQIDPTVDDPEVLWVNPERLFILQYIDNPAGAVEPSQ